MQLIDWSSDKDYGLLYIKESPDQFNHSLWLLSMAEQNLSLISQRAHFQGVCNDPFRNTLWNHNNQAVFVSGEKQPIILTASNRKVEELSLPDDTSIKLFSPIRWTPTNELIFITQNSRSIGNEIYKYSTENKVLTLLVPSSESETMHIEFFSTIKNNRFVYGATMVDVTTGSQEQVLSADPRFGEFLTRELIWHPSEEWGIVLAYADAFWQLHSVFVSSLDNTFQRMVSVCLPSSKSCFGWLPDLNK